LRPRWDATFRDLAQGGRGARQLSHCVVEFADERTDLRLHVLEQLIDRRQGRVQVRQAVLQLRRGSKPVEIANDSVEVHADVFERNGIQLIEKYSRLCGYIGEVA